VLGGQPLELLAGDLERQVVGVLARRDERQPRPAGLDETPRVVGVQHGRARHHPLPPPQRLADVRHLLRHVIKVHDRHDTRYPARIDR
jgi:hypothetical protein